MSRMENSAKNTGWSITYTLATTLIGFAVRTIFIAQLGTWWQGLTALFTSLLGFLAFADLGLGAAISYSLYKPVAEGNGAEIKAIIQFTRRVFFVVMAVVAVGGVILAFFLPYLFEGAADIDNLYLYYGIYLVNILASYMLTYKVVYMTARQEAWRTVKLNILFWLLTAAGQITVLLVRPSYLLYLLATIGGTLLDKLVTSLYLNRKYPIVKEKSTDKPPPEVVSAVKRNVKGLMAHRLGNIVITSTDNVIVSHFIALAVTGMVDQYTLLRTTVLTFITNLSNAILPSMGNLVVSEGRETQLDVFKVYNLIRFCFVSLCFCGLGVLSTPFISLWLGAAVTVDEGSVFLMCLTILLFGQHTSVDLLRDAHGTYGVGRTLAIAEAAANILLSVLFVRQMGLPGVYLGTVLSSLIQFIGKPILVLRSVYGMGPGWYFLRAGGYTALALANYALVRWLVSFMLATPTWPMLLLAGLVTVLVTAAVHALALCKDPAFKAALAMGTDFIRAKLKR